MTITEQIIEKIQGLSLDEQKRLLEMLSAATRVQKAAEIGETEIRNGPVGTRHGSVGAKLVALAKKAEAIPTDLPADLAANHDYYLHGLPKRS
jgi:hypothetical protein